MNEGDNFGATNGGSNPPSSASSFKQPTDAIMSNPKDHKQGGIKVVSPDEAPKASKFFGSHSRRPSADVIDRSQTEFLATQNIASNPNNPQFFRDAAAENAVAQAERQPRPRSNKNPIFLGLIVLVVLVIAGAIAAYFLLPSSSDNSGNEEKPKTTSEHIEKYLSLVIGDDYKDVLKKGYVDYSQTYAIESKINTNNRKDANSYYGEVIAELYYAIDSLDDSEKDLKKILNQDAESILYVYESSRAIYPNTGKEYDIKEIDDNISHIKEKKDAFEDKDAKRLYEKITSYLDANRKIITIYKENGCLSNGKINDDCVEKIDASVFSDLPNTKALKIQISNINAINIKTIKEDVFTVNLKLKGSDDEKAN